MKFIDLEELEFFHNQIIERTGGIKGIRDKDLLESSINKPFQTFGGEDLYKEIIDKISAITYSLINNHGFIDGNKRIGVSVMLLLLRLNDVEIKYTQQDLIEFGLIVAKGKYNEESIKEWIEKKRVKKA
ncbi:type II toxin-antitoxin system death-on-curing family toxin [Herbivorax sp. ANBcel31]|uniref:type II toxin-antitoxin system death-on-curing family toxin n=1 Tax=Herbivorax sp. ANBcel31 TaxID=3069754 RepID=UPI0027B83A2F|nr:type II toxin-antitoxin system death-on-curing family toxin [Herbivorax sp. ANBcel31]MDQ2087964.1 type II toxin-antitoxin system death-on-curing family toxin [Herbivorax sp. ANBcel31]